MFSSSISHAVAAVRIPVDHLYEGVFAAHGSLTGQGIKNDMIYNASALLGSSHVFAAAVCVPVEHLHDGICAIRVLLTGFMLIKYNKTHTIKCLHT
jgi:hypothetical protein